MTKTIAQLWSGNLKPVECSGRTNQEMQELEVLMQRNLDKLEGMLDEKQSEILKKYNDCIEEYLTVSGEQIFCDGFSLGAKITAEALCGTEME